MPTNKPDGEDVQMHVVELRAEQGFIRRAIQARLDFISKLEGVPSDQAPLQLDDSAFTRLEELSQNSVGLALLALRLTCERVLSARSLPCTLTAADVDNLGMSSEDLEELWDHPLRDAAIVEVKPWWERE